MIRSEHLAYFKDLLEGQAEISWNAWFRRNEQQLSQDLSRSAFLRLKFNKLDEAETLLKDAGVKYDLSPLAKQERYYSLLHESVLDEKGRPKEDFRRRAYDGALGYFMAGDIARGKSTLNSFVEKISQAPILKRVETLENLCFDGEIEFELGDRKLGKAMLEAIAALAKGDDLLDPIIIRACQVLARG